MAKKFRRWDVEQRWLLPPSMRELGPNDHPAHFVRELVRHDLDLSAILDCFRSFLLRGLENVVAEWSMVCTAHNLLKLMRAPVAKPT